jgi:hypothetical protein
MRLFSTEESRRNNEVTVLAIIETLLAMVASIAVAVYTKSLLHIAIGACVAPLLLLRTDKSIALGKRLFEKYKPDWYSVKKIEALIGHDNDFLSNCNASDDSRPFKNRLLYAVYDYFCVIKYFVNLLFLALLVTFKFLLMFAISFGVRVVATLAISLSDPILTMKSIRSNWLRNAFCTDAVTTAELIPGGGPVSRTVADTAEGEFEPDVWYFRSNLKGVILYMVYGGIFAAIPTFASLVFIGFHESFVFVTKVFYMYSLVCLFMLFLNGLHNILMAFLVAFIYRFSIKSTAILWLPLLFIPNEVFSIGSGLKTEHRNAWSSLTRNYSLCVLALFFGKVFLLPTVIDWWNTLPFTKVLNVWVMPNVIHPWHIASVFLAVMNLGSYYFFFDPAPRNLEEGTWSPSFVENTFVAIKFVTATVSIYTIWVGIYLTWKAVLVAKYPEFDWRLFPW